MQTVAGAIWWLPVTLIQNLPILPCSASDQIASSSWQFQHNFWVSGNKNTLLHIIGGHKLDANCCRSYMMASRNCCCCWRSGVRLAIIGGFLPAAAGLHAALFWGLIFFFSQRVKNSDCTIQQLEIGLTISPVSTWVCPLGESWIMSQESWIMSQESWIMSPESWVKNYE